MMKPKIEIYRNDNRMAYTGCDTCPDKTLCGECVPSADTLKKISAAGYKIKIDGKAWKR
ncbi:MAG: hypothetical protein FWE62_04780 [Firmicutes bacterium]|nr:hypothetical protein [Bacillota bacterium]